MKESLDIFIEEIGLDRFKPLTLEQERELLKDWPREDCKRKLIEHNLRFSIDLAKKFRGSRLPMEDLVCASNQGLCVAADRFDPERGFKFISYAVWWMRQHIFFTVAGDRTVRLPANIDQDIREIESFVSKFYQENGRYPTGDEVEEGSGITRNKFDHVQKSTQSVWSLDKEFDDDAERSLIRYVADEESHLPDLVAEENERRDHIQKMLETKLTDQEQDILRRYFGFDGKNEETLEAIAESYNLTRERIRQIKFRALRKLKHPGNKLILEHR